MGLFSKKEYETFELPFYLEESFNQEATKEALAIDIIFYGSYRGAKMYFRVCFQYYNEECYDQMRDYLRQYENNTPIKIKINVKKIQDFNIDLEDMADKLSNSEIRKFERMGWGAFTEDEFRKE